MSHQQGINMKQRESGLPFDDIRNLVSGLPELDDDARAHTSGQLSSDDNVLFADYCQWYSACTGRSPSIHRPSATLFAGTHTIENLLDGGRSADDLLDCVTAISEGSAYINRLCHQNDVGLKVFDLALQIPVDDITRKAALDEKSCAGTIAFGMEAIAGGADLLCVAALDMKPGLSALAILTALGDMNFESLLRQRGDDAETAKANLSKAVSMIDGHVSNPLEVLRRLGGRETAAICGAILAARSQHIPVLIDGLTALAAALVLYRLEPSSLDHVKFAQTPQNSDLVRLLEKIGLSALIPATLVSSAEEGVVLGAGVLKSACLLVQGRP